MAVDGGRAMMVVWFIYCFQRPGLMPGDVVQLVAEDAQGVDGGGFCAEDDGAEVEWQVAGGLCCIDLGSCEVAFGADENDCALWSAAGVGFDFTEQ